MKFFVTTPIYYVNAKPHIGHIYATVSSDVLARHYRTEGYDVLFSTGVDENSQKNVDAAEKAGKSTQEYVDEMAKVWKKTFDEFNISFDTFVRTTSAEHEKAVTTLLTKIKEAGDIYLGDYEGYYCVGCEEFKNESDVEDGKCAIHQTPLKLIKEKNYFFKLSKYKDQLLKYYEAHPDFVQPSSARNKMLYYIENELNDVSISRQAQEWGIRLPDDPNHAIYVWFDALINYLTVTGYPDEEKFRIYWPADVHVIGKDIIKFHCAIWPAMLLSAKLPLPHVVFAHGFFTVDGQKISKSLGNAIDPFELAKDYPLDAIRYYLLREIPFGSDGDFSHERLKERYNADLANGLGNLVSRVLNMIEKFAPELTLNDAISLPTEMQTAVVDSAAHIKALQFDKALGSIWQLVAWADGLIEETKPWELAKAGETDNVTHVLAKLLGALQEIHKALEPLLPDTHATLAEILTVAPLKKPETPLFERKD